MKKVLALCAQMAEALAKANTASSSNAFSPALKPSRELIKMLKNTERYYILIDIVVTMGCNVNCPYHPCKSREDWGQDDAVFKKAIGIIEKLDHPADRIRRGSGS